MRKKLISQRFSGLQHSFHRRAGRAFRVPPFFCSPFCRRAAAVQTTSPPGFPIGPGPPKSKPLAPAKRSGREEKAAAMGFEEKEGGVNRQVAEAEAPLLPPLFSRLRRRQSGPPSPLCAEQHQGGKDVFKYRSRPPLRPAAGDASHGSVAARFGGATPFSPSDRAEKPTFPCERPPPRGNKGPTPLWDQAAGRRYWPAKRAPSPPAQPPQMTGAGQPHPLAAQKRKIAAPTSPFITPLRG